MNRRGGAGPLTMHALALLDDAEAFEERAAIMEYDAHMPRRAAERAARDRMERTRSLRRKLLAAHVAAASGMVLR